MSSNEFYSRTLDALKPFFIAVGIAGLTFAGAQAQETAKDFNGETLIVQTYGGSVGRFFQNVIGPEFEKRYDAKLVMTVGQTMDQVAKMRANAGRQESDTWMVAENGAIILGAEGLSEPLTTAGVPNLEKIIAAGRQQGDKFVTFSLASTTLAYNTNKMKPDELPKTWADLADSKYKGDVLLPGGNSVFSTMFIAHMAELHGGSVANVDPAFDVLKKIAPNVLTYWTSYDQAFSMLNSGQAAMMVTAVDRTVDQALKGAPVNTYYPKGGVIFIGNSIGISKGSKHTKLAEAYINFVLSPEVQKQIADNFGMIPVMPGVNMDPKVQALLPDPSTMSASYSPDWAAIGKNQAAWSDRYMKEILNN